MNIIAHYRLFRLRVHRHCVRAERRRMRKLLEIRVKLEPTRQSVTTKRDGGITRFRYESNSKGFK